jgi:hypothetical protein
LTRRLRYHHVFELGVGRCGNSDSDERWRLDATAAMPCGYSRVGPSRLPNSWHASLSTGIPTGNSRSTRIIMIQNSFRKYQDNERCCPICNTTLAAHQTWPGAQYRYCLQPACTTVVRENLKGGCRYIGPGEQPCTALGCSAFVPEGRYATNPSRLVCSPECCMRAPTERPILLCACGCGQQLSANGLNPIFQPTAGHTFHPAWLSSALQQVN